jgi:phosphatidylinositol-3-phosphatase
MGIRNVGAALVVVALTAGVARTTVGSPSIPAGSACGSKSGPPATFAHVIWIWMENHSYPEIIGGSSAPYINSLARVCGLATNYKAVAHPSLPNYIAATSGGTQAITDDDPPSSHPLTVSNIFQQARSARSYEESMPRDCALASVGAFAVKHDPEAYFVTVRAGCKTDDVPLGTIAGSAFLKALGTSRLPAFSFVTPNLCNDMHDCSIETGDRWLKRWVPKITASATYRAGSTVLFITWDEDDRSDGNHVATIVVSPYTMRGTTSAVAFTHYSLLRTTEELLGIRVHLGLAARAPSMRAAFGL